MAKRGGYRPGGGRKHKWNSGDTRAIRVPEVFADRLLELARFMDDDGRIRVYKLRGSDVVHVKDLPNSLGCVQKQTEIEWFCTKTNESYASQKESDS